MTPDLDALLTDIKNARQQRGMNAWWQDVLQRAHRAIGDLRELSAVLRSGCDNALTQLEFCATVCSEQREEIDRLRAAIRVNGLRWGCTDAEIEAVLNPGTMAGADQ